ncbi:MAG: Uma2 family endonuclease [Tetrasphaera sp.]
MTAMTALPRSRPLTVADLESTPDDGHRYELIDGALIVTPAPVTRHQRASFRLGVALLPGLPEGYEILHAPFDVVLAQDTVLQPDVVVVRVADLTERNLPTAPVLAVEILSPSTRRIDLLLKRSRLEAAGCPSYWVVDPDVPSIIAWDLRDGGYVEVGSAAQDEAVTYELPYPVTIRPADLIA